MSTASVSIDRTALDLPPLVIADTLAPTTTYMLTKDGLGRPAVTWRMTAMPDSADVHGTEYVAGVKEQSSLPLQVLVSGATYAELEDAIDALTDAVSQWAYTATVTVDGVARVWSCGPAEYGAASGLIESSHVAAHVDLFNLTIPVYPIPGV